MTPAELKAWRDRCNLSDKEAAAALALSLQGFRNQMYGCVRVSKRTERMTELVERSQPTP